MGTIAERLREIERAYLEDRLGLGRVYELAAHLRRAERFIVRGGGVKLREDAARKTALVRAYMNSVLPVVVEKATVTRDGYLPLWYLPSVRLGIRAVIEGLDEVARVIDENRDKWGEYTVEAALGARHVSEVALEISKAFVRGVSRLKVGYRLPVWPLWYAARDTGSGRIIDRIAGDSRYQKLVFEAEDVPLPSHVYGGLTVNELNVGTLKDVCSLYGSVSGDHGLFARLTMSGLKKHSSVITGVIDDLGLSSVPYVYHFRFNLPKLLRDTHSELTLLLNAFGSVDAVPVGAEQLVESLKRAGNVLNSSAVSGDGLSEWVLVLADVDNSVTMDELGSAHSILRSLADAVREVWWLGTSRFYNHICGLLYAVLTEKFDFKYSGIITYASKKIRSAVERLRTITDSWSYGGVPYLFLVVNEAGGTRLIRVAEGSRCEEVLWAFHTVRACCFGELADGIVRLCIGGEGERIDALWSALYSHVLSDVALATDLFTEVEKALMSGADYAVDVDELDSITVDGFIELADVEGTGYVEDVELPDVTYGVTDNIRDPDEERIVEDLDGLNV